MTLFKNRKSHCQSFQESKQQTMELSDKVSHLESVQRANNVLWEAERTKHTSSQRELVLVKTEKERAIENLATKSSMLEAEITKRREFENKSTELKAALKVAKDTVQRCEPLCQNLIIISMLIKILFCNQIFEKHKKWPN